MKRIFTVLAALLLAMFVLAAAASGEEGQDPADPAAADSPSAETQTETQPETPAETQPETQPETPAEDPSTQNPQDSAQPEAQPETPAETQPVTQPETEPITQEPSDPAQPETAAETEPAATEAPVCLHESTGTTYYFDAPSYRALDEESHVVFGRATVEVTCLICGEVLSVTVEDNAEEICAHVFRKGKCALCGREGGPAEEPAAAAGREVVYMLSPAESDSDQYFRTMSGSDLDTAADTLVFRPEGSDAAVVVNAGKLRDVIDRTGGTLTVEIEAPGSRNVNAFVRLYAADGAETVPEGQEISLRIYGENGGASLTVSYTDAEGGTSSEEAGWVSAGESYWNVTWRGNGMYTY